MITRWEEISDRVADKLGLGRDEVRDAVLKMAKQTQAHAMHPDLMETDVFGIGYLTVKFNRIKPSAYRLKRVRAIRERFMQACLDRGTEKELEKAMAHRESIRLIDKDLEMLEEFLAEKDAIYKSYGRKKYVKKLKEALAGTDWANKLKKKYKMATA